MAQDPFSIIKETAPKISSLQEQLSKYQDRLSASPTAASSNTDPTRADINNEVQQRSLQTQLRALQKKNLSAAWYGADNEGAADQGGSPGVIGTALNVLQRPLHTVVKGVKGLIGDTTDVPNQEFTDLLRQHGVSGPAGAALGFTLDVALDPVNWLTAGTAALIPRVGAGLVRGAAKGGVEGAVRAGTQGLTSSLGQKAAFVARWTPFVNKEGPFVQRLSEKAAQSYENYKVLTGLDPMQHITSSGIARGMKTGALGGLGPEAGVGLTVGDFYRGVLSYIPYGDDFYKATYYDSRNWLDVQKQRDVQDALKARTTEESLAAGAPSAAAIAARESDTFEAGIANSNLELLKNIPPGQEKNAIIDLLNKQADDLATIGRNPSKIVSANPEQNTFRILQEAVTADGVRITLAPLIEQFSSGGPSGIKWWDDTVQWGNKVKMKIGENEIAPIRAFLDTYNSIITGVFKPAHTVLSPVTWAMNVMSALPMYMMMGGENALGFMRDYKNAYLAYAGINPEGRLVKDLLGMPTKAREGWKASRTADVRGFMEKFPETTRKSLGAGPGWFFGHHSLKGMVDKSVAEGLYTAEQAASGVAERELLASQGELREFILSEDQSVTQKIAGFFGKFVHSPAETPSQVLESLTKRTKTLGKKGLGHDLPSETVAGFVNEDPEIPTELLNKVKAFIKAKADEGNRPFSVFQNLIDTARAGYGHQDQAFRTAVVNQLINHGITEHGLKTMTRFVPMTNPETQIVSTYVLNGQKMIRPSMDYALEVAHEAAINYGAMPAAIRMLRSMPLLGAPFASFSYGMGIKTAQTLAYNPSFFNKVSFGIQSASGHKTPLEKEALKSKYYDWYNDPSMMRLPDAVNFFSEYPLYWNLSNALPYYSLNIFQPANRSYDSVLPNAIVQLLDRAPVMKDPLGQTIFDNLLLPTLLSNAERPKSQLGSPLYPINATAADKAFYAGRGLVDALTPAVVAPAGLMLPSDYAKYYPGYRTRQMSFGKEGMSAQGIPDTEEPASHTMRNIMGYLGLPFQRLNTKYAESQAKKSGKAP